MNNMAGYTAQPGHALRDERIEAPLLKRIAELEAELRVMTTKAIAMEEVAPLAVKKAKSWPASWAMQPTADQFVSMALQEYTAMKEQA